MPEPKNKYRVDKGGGVEIVAADEVVFINGNFVFRIYEEDGTKTDVALFPQIDVSGVIMVREEPGPFAGMDVPTPLYKASVAVLAERARQRTKYDEAHDEGHDWGDWVALIEKQLEFETTYVNAQETPKAAFTRAAAVCFAALEALYRREARGG